MIGRKKNLKSNPFKHKKRKEQKKKHNNEIDGGDGDDEGLFCFHSDVIFGRAMEII